MDLEKIKNDCVNNLEELKKVISTLEIKTFKEIEIEISKFNEIEKLTKNQSFIYLLEMDNTIKILKDFRNRRCNDSDGSLNLSKFNEENQNSNILYVGSSTSDLNARLKSHFGFSSHKTYSLHLNKWANSEQYKIKITILKVQNSMDKKPVERKILEILEHQIWDDFKPIFGKRSGQL